MLPAVVHAGVTLARARRGAQSWAVIVTACSPAYLAVTSGRCRGLCDTLFVAPSWQSTVSADGPADLHFCLSDRHITLCTVRNPCFQDRFCALAFQCHVLRCPVYWRGWRAVHRNRRQRHLLPQQPALPAHAYKRCEQRRITECHNPGSCMARRPCIRASALLWALAFLASGPGTHVPFAQLQFSPLSRCVTLHACMYAAALACSLGGQCDVRGAIPPASSSGSNLPRATAAAAGCVPTSAGASARELPGAPQGDHVDHAAQPMQAIQKMNVHAKQPETTNSCLFAHFCCRAQVTLAQAGYGPSQTVAWTAPILTIPGTGSAGVVTVSALQAAPPNTGLLPASFTSLDTTPGVAPSLTHPLLPASQVQASPGYPSNNTSKGDAGSAGTSNQSSSPPYLSIPSPPPYPPSAPPPVLSPTPSVPCADAITGLPIPFSLSSGQLPSPAETLPPMQPDSAMVSSPRFAVSPVATMASGISPDSAMPLRLLYAAMGATDLSGVQVSGEQPPW